MLGVSDAQIFFERLAEIARRPFVEHDVRVIPRLLLVLRGPHFAVHLKCQEIGARELRVVGIFSRPCGQRVVGEREARYQMLIGRVGAGADRVVVKGVVDSEVAHFHASEVFVAGRGTLEDVKNMLLPLREFRCLFFRTRPVCGALGAALGAGSSRNRRREAQRQSPGS